MTIYSDIRLSKVTDQKVTNQKHLIVNIKMSLDLKLYQPFLHLQRKTTSNAGSVFLLSSCPLIFCKHV